MCTLGVLGLSCGKGRYDAGGFEAAGASHDSPRTPNVHISGPRRFKHHQNSTKGPQEREERKRLVAGEGKKSAKFWAPHPSGPHTSGPHPCMNCVCPPRKMGGWVGGVGEGRVGGWGCGGGWVGGVGEGRGGGGVRGEGDFWPKSNKSL